MMVEKGRHEYMYVEESHVLVRHMIRTKPPKAGGQLRETLEGLNLTQRRAVHTPLAMHLGGGSTCFGSWKDAETVARLWIWHHLIHAFEAEVVTPMS